MTAMFTCLIPGQPRPQGSLRIIPARGAGRAFAKHSDTTTEHHNHSALHLRAAWASRAPLTGPVRVEVVFTFARPAGHYGTGRNATQLKRSAPTHHCGHVDVDKLLRLQGDALVAAGVLADDQQIVVLRGEKRWGDTGHTLIRLWDDL